MLGLESLREEGGGEVDGSVLGCGEVACVERDSVGRAGLTLLQALMPLSWTWVGIQGCFWTDKIELWILDIVVRRQFRGLGSPYRWGQPALSSVAVLRRRFFFILRNSLD